MCCRIAVIPVYLNYVFCSTMVTVKYWYKYVLGTGTGLYSDMQLLYISLLTDRAKKNAIKSSQNLSNLLVDTVNRGVEEAFLNEKRIEIEIRALLGTISRYKKQTDQWLATTHELNTVLKVLFLFCLWKNFIY